jgi:hypothetical protein
MPDLARASRVADAVAMMTSEFKGQPYAVRLRFGMMIPILRGHKVTAEGMKESAAGSFNQCEVCGQVVKVPREGDGIEGRATENDCPAAEWRRP